MIIYKMINWNSGANLSNNGKSDYLRNGSFSSSTENSTKLIMPKKGTLSNLVVQLDSFVNGSNPAPGNGHYRTFTIRKNCVDTDLSVTICDDRIVGETEKNISVRFKKFDVITLVHRSSIGIHNPALAIASVSVS